MPLQCVFGGNDCLLGAQSTINPKFTEIRIFSGCVRWWGWVAGFRWVLWIEKRVVRLRWGEHWASPGATLYWRRACVLLGSLACLVEWPSGDSRTMGWSIQQPEVMIDGVLMHDCYCMSEFGVLALCLCLRGTILPFPVDGTSKKLLWPTKKYLEPLWPTEQEKNTVWPSQMQIC